MIATRTTRTLRRIALPLLLLGCCAAASAQNCDCSCEAYQRLQSVMAEYEKQQEAGQQRIPPELMQMGMCAGQCAMHFAKCENPDLDVDAMQQAQQRALQQAGQQRNNYGDAAIARERAIHERSIGETEKNMQADSGLPKEQLTGEYLEGTWCSLYGGQETTQWQFDADGGYRIGVPAGRGYAMQPQVRSREHFVGRFETLVERETDTFTTVHEHGRKNVFTRGPCD